MQRPGKSLSHWVVFMTPVSGFCNLHGLWHFYCLCHSVLTTLAKIAIDSTPNSVAHFQLLMHSGFLLKGKFSHALTVSYRYAMNSSHFSSYFLSPLTIRVWSSFCYYFPLLLHASHFRDFSLPPSLAPPPHTHTLSWLRLCW